MPLFPTSPHPNQVSFLTQPTLCRPPTTPENSAIHAFARHASHCRHCQDPYLAHLSGGTLCERGSRRARAVVRYLYLDSTGRTCSTYADEEGDGYSVVRVEIPYGCDSVRGLLKAVERGLRFEQRSSTKSNSKPKSRYTTKPIVSYDKTYLVKSRTPKTSEQRETTTITTTSVPSKRSRRPQVEIVDYPSSPSLVSPSVSRHSERVVYVDERGNPFDLANQLGLDDSSQAGDGVDVVYAAPLRRERRRSTSLIREEGRRRSVLGELFFR
ncbi:MAG: hypothetical protein M1817_000423 [Caeruleum heppii]|nr:MAG: hypothetical protein M1817_000423 [Caeruleum heppii]